MIVDSDKIISETVNQQEAINDNSLSARDKTIPQNTNQ